MLRQSHVVSTLEGLYSDEGDAGAWAQRVAGGLADLFASDEQIGFVGFDSVRHEVLFLAMRGRYQSSPYEGALVSAMGGMTEQEFARLYRPPHPVFLLSAAEESYLSKLRAVSQSPRADVLGLVTEPEPRIGVALSMVFSETPRVPGRMRRTLAQVALHIEAAARLRLRPDAVVGYVTPQGRVELGVEGELSSKGAGDLRDAARGVDRARTRARRADGEEALGVWRALVAGRYSLAERTERDGKRVYALYENAPRHAPMRALTEREGFVVHECARGLANKEVGYALGISASSVSEALASAARKLGAHDPGALVRVASGLRGAGAPVASLAGLTSAERAVAALVVRGLTNEQIAHARASAVRTVANQVAAVLRKCAVRSRRELAVGARAAAAPGAEEG